MTRARDVANLIGSGNYSSTTFTATAGQTAFTISHTQGFIQVFMNGLLLDETVDYTSNGSAVTLTSGAAAGDEIEVVAYNTFSVGDALNQAAADTRYVNTSGDTMSGNLLLGSNSVGIGTNAPLRQLHISNTSANSEIAFTAGTSGVSSILFGDGLTGTDVYKGYLQYNHAQDKMLIATAAGSSINIDSAGRVTMPYQPAFYAYSNTSVQSSGGTMQFQNEGLDVTNSYNNSTGVFTAPVAGVYEFHAYLLARFDHPTAVATNKYLGARLYKNGSQWGADHYQQNGATRNHEAVSFSVIGSLAANDTVLVNITLAAGATTYGGNYSSFSGKLIS